jgi:hypothetical protein
VSTDGIKVAYASALDPNDVADQFGLQAAKAKVQTLNDDSAVIAGLQRGSIDVGNVDFDQAAAAVAKGMPIKIIYAAQTTWPGRRSATRDPARRPRSSSRTSSSRRSRPSRARSSSSRWPSPRAVRRRWWPTTST